MKPHKLFALALSLALLLFATESAFAKSSSHGHGNNKPERPKINASDATIEKISSGSITVKSARKIQTYAIDGHTAILLANVRSSASALQKGMLVSIHASTLHPTTAESIIVDDPSARASETPKSSTSKKSSHK